MHKFQLIVSLVLVWLAGGASISHAQDISLKSDTQTATAGYYQLNWSMPQGQQGADYIVEEELPGTGSKKAYRVADTAMVISGKPNGTYIYRVRSADNQYSSNTVKVVVAHHSLSTAFRFFVLGAIVFIVLLIVILRGNKLVNNG